MFGSAAGFVAQDQQRRRNEGPRRSEAQSQDHHVEVSQRSTYSGFSFDADSARSLADFDESDLEDSSYTSASNFAVVRRQAMNPAPSMLLVSMLEHLCSLYETDQEKRNKLFKVICEHLTKMKIVSGVSWLDEFSSVREQYKKAFSNLVSAAVESVRTDAVVHYPLPTTAADRIKILFQDSPLFSPRPSPAVDAFQTFASRYANEFLEMDRLGKGGFGRVFKVKNKLDGQEYAVKKIFLKESNMDVFFRIVREVKLLASLQHANVVRYHTAWMEYSNPILNSNRSSSTNLQALETSFLQDVHNIRSSYMYADSSSIVFQESAASDSEATVLKRHPTAAVETASRDSSSGYDVSVESYLHDRNKWKLGLSDESLDLSEYREKDEDPNLEETNQASAQNLTSHSKEQQQIDMSNKKTLVDTVEWESPDQEVVGSNSEKPSNLSDTIPWESSRKEEAGQNSTSGGKMSKHQDTIEWETARKEGAEKNKNGKQSKLQHTIPWETPKTDKTVETLESTETIEWDTSGRDDNSEKPTKLLDTMEWETSPTKEEQNMAKDNRKPLDVTFTLEGKASSKSPLDSKEPVVISSTENVAAMQKGTQMPTSDRALRTSHRLGKGLEQEIHVEAASFSSGVMRFGHSMPGALVPFTSTPKEPRSQDTLDLPDRESLRSWSGIKRQHSWNPDIKNGHTTETHVCGDRCKLRLKGLADCDLVAETSGVVLYIQMQLCQRSLRDWMASRNAQAALLRDSFGAISEADNMRLFQQILQGVNYIHSQGLMHRDLKPPNIFLIGEDDQVCIGDFGLAREDLLDTQGSSPPLTPLEIPDMIAGETTHTSGVGTCTYASPEQLKGTTYNSKSDMYSLGVILFELFHPFGTEMERAKSIQGLRQGRALPPTLVQRWPRQCDFMQLLTSLDPKYRPIAKDILSSDLFHSKDEVIASLKAKVDKQSQEMEELRRQLKEKTDMLFQLRRSNSTP